MQSLWPTSRLWTYQLWTWSRHIEQEALRLCCGVGTLSACKLSWPAYKRVQLFAGATKHPGVSQAAVLHLELICRNHEQHVGLCTPCTSVGWLERTAAGI